jgi:hypothetical protein
MRIFIPATPGVLATANNGSWTPTQAFAVNPDLVASLADDGPEGGSSGSDGPDHEVADEYIRDAAALASVTDLGSPRRVVIVADVPASLVTPAPDRHLAAVDVTGAIPAGSVVCAFVDEAEAEADARAVDKGDTEALARLEFRNLLWYDVAELPYLD